MSKSGNTKIIVRCIQCGKEREITKQQIRRTKYTGLCANCSRESRKGENHPSWRGGLRLGGQNGAYITIHKPEHPFANSSGYVLQHRLVSEEMLGRYLSPEEVPHHLNGDTKDNCWSNIIVLSNQASHVRLHKHLEQQASEKDAEWEKNIFAQSSERAAITLMEEWEKLVRAECQARIEALIEEIEAMPVIERFADEKSGAVESEGYYIDKPFVEALKATKKGGE